MIRRFLGLLPLAASLLLCGGASAADVKVGYLGLKDDLRYHPEVAYTRIEISPALNPVEGARLGLEDLKIVTDAVDIAVTLDEQQATDAADASAKVAAMAAAGERFVILDLPGDIVSQVATAAAALPITLVNATASQDALRDLCQPNLIHTGASDRMIADTYTQFLRHRNWTKVLILVGKEPRDKEIADAFEASAKRLRLDIRDRREFTTSTDPANREANNTMLVTGGTDYDVVFIADSLSEYARYLNYATQLPRPVIGTTGLTASEWHWSWDRDGATQVTLRFQRLAHGGRVMSGSDWSTWIAAKSIATAYAKARSDDPQKIYDYMRGNRFNIDGSKGYRMNFRPWDGQLRMPTVLATSNAVTEAAPFPEFLHQTNELDTLGVDEPESKCKAP
ncbi:ABC transporter substrate-binding protein [Devosia sp. CN2-171]|uniref:ABC transporter substrate-binding protein n=1 Tax=Devosia sp. CN2-171 TaxID=3400909 RepID=UPI003BF8CC9E